MATDEPTDIRGGAHKVEHVHAPVVARFSPKVHGGTAWSLKLGVDIPRALQGGSFRPDISGRELQERLDEIPGVVNPWKAPASDVSMQARETAACGFVSVLRRVEPHTTFDRHRVRRAFDMYEVRSQAVKAAHQMLTDEQFAEQGRISRTEERASRHRRMFGGRPGLQLVLASFGAVSFLVIGIVLFIAAIAPHPLRPSPYVAATLILSGASLVATLVVAVAGPRRE